MADFENIIKGGFVRKIIAVILPVVTTSFALIPKSNDCSFANQWIHEFMNGKIIDFLMFEFRVELSTIS